MGWMKLHDDFRTDPKLRSLPFGERWVLLCLMSMAHHNTDAPGTIQDVPDHILALECADGDVALLEKALQSGVSLRILSCVMPLDATDAETPDETVKHDETIVKRVSPFHSVSSRFIVFLNHAKRQHLKRGETSTERVRKHRQDKRLRQRKRDETRMKQSETRFSASDSDSDTEKKYPPNPPGGETARGGLSTSTQTAGNDPLDTPDDPPAATDFDPEPPPVPNDPAEVARVGLLAEELLAIPGGGRMVAEAARRFQIGWIREAVEITQAAGRSDWRYVTGILRRFAAQGGPDSARLAVGPAKPKPRLPPAPALPLLRDAVKTRPGPVSHPESQGCDS